VKLEVVTSADQVAVDVPFGRSSTRVDLSGQPVDSIRIELVPEDGRRSLVGISELGLPGVTIRQVLVPPAMELLPGQSAAVVLSALSGHRDACVVGDAVFCAGEFARSGEEEHGIARRIELSGSREFDIAVSAAPRAGPAIDRLIGRSAGGAGQVSASSASVLDPLGGAMAAVDADIGTGWVAGPFDPDPTLELSWPTPTKVSGLDLSWSASLAASRPTVVTVVAGGASRSFSVQEGGRVDMPPMRTRSLELHFAGAATAYDYDTSSRRYSRLPIGVSELRVVGADVGAPLLRSSKLADVGCGDGPDVMVDGQQFMTSATVPVARLSRLDAARLTVCGPNRVNLAAGTHEVEVVGDSRWRPVQVALTSPDWKSMSSASTAVDANVAPSSWAVDVPGNATPGLLTVRQNANAGWKAESEGGESLQTVAVDGWMQGYLVPADAGHLEVSFVPARTYEVALAGGLGVMLVLFACACVPSRREAGPTLRSDRLREPVSWILIVVAAIVLGGLSGLVAAGVAFASLSVVRAKAGDPGRAHLAAAGWVASLLLAAGALLAWPPLDSTGSGLQWTIQMCGLLAVASLAVVATGRLEMEPHQRMVDPALERPGDADADDRGDDEHIAR
jgi:arabinofuranan 3-O-arabinosyltransferase